ncbi:LysR family transcriptional regulator [Gluconobacter kanchanaburiensis]|uniref:LysR family transcriptional regulator n=1 Tax=Gluconobacter kanchanaburiensis NBRC 103587 TaxID=1307948 RepID=A0A511BEQ4_9PROT|nr:LysR family transcriptional regulator [Gluconobacter kanchanaburiensis]MBF0860514.1 LysR family transcriptional regulator [Gluconobacter kanchanaburiensis]GBR69268.1 LysR family transcriptional regulator [Gluconobacter kanchanaburiensis NBRC 103587]GEK96237.1 LysR family transcriptional regulator [Gluconobacter kanchanaburiensis NBRC 103587]
MTLARRFLPSTTLLCSFEAAARHQSFTAAAEELKLTQSAVSRHIRALESHLGSTLFLRDRQTVRLTKAGEHYVREIREALRHISAATLAFRANPGGGSINLGVLPTFGARWLAPRLIRFAAKHPDITVNLHTHLQPFDFSTDPLDAAIHFGLPEWPGTELSFLMTEDVVAVCSPDLARKLRISSCEDLLTAPLLHLTSRPNAWENWFLSHGTESISLQGALFDQFSFIIAAAIQGTGCAMIPRFLIREELADGTLIQLTEPCPRGEEAYYFVRPLSHPVSKSLSQFREWLVEEAAHDRENFSLSAVRSLVTCPD